MSRSIKAFAISCALFLTACASIPLTSLPKLMGLNIETVDPGALELAVIVPDTVGIRPGSAVLSFTLVDEETEEALDLRQTVDMPVEALDSVLLHARKPGQTVHRFALSDEAAQTVKRYREEAMAFRNARKDTTGSLSANVGFCRLDDQTFPTEVDMTVYIKTKPDQSFFKLLRTQTLDMSDAATIMNESDKHLCAEASGTDAERFLNEAEIEKG